MSLSIASNTSNYWIERHCIAWEDYENVDIRTLPLLLQLVTVVELAKSREHSCSITDNTICLLRGAGEINERSTRAKIK